MEFFSIIILLGLSYVLKDDGHVRIDIFYEHFSAKTKAVVNMLGMVFFILPLSLLVAWFGLDYVLEAYKTLEGSSDPVVLAYRWIIKAFIPLSFLLLIFFSIGYFIKNLNLYLKAKGRK